MREGWTPFRLGDLIRLEYGKALPAKQRSGSGYPVFGSAGEVGRHSEFLVNGPGIVVGRKGTAGSVTWTDEAFYPIDTTYWVHILSDVLDLRFAFLLLSASRLDEVTTQTGVPGLNRENAYRLEVSIPPIEEQRRIVDLVGHVDSSIEAQSVEAVSVLALWVGTLRATQPKEGREYRLHELFSYVIGGAWGRPPDEDETSVLALGTSAYAGEALTVDPEKGTARSLSGDRALKRGIKQGDILLERSGGSPTQPVGRVIRALVDTPHVVPSDFQRLLRPNTEVVDPAFAFWTLWMNYQDGVVLPYQKNTTSIRNLQVTEYLAGAKVVVPSLEAQREWVAVAEEFERLVGTQRAELDKAKRLRASLLASLLSGQHEVPASYDEFIRDEGAA